MKTTVKSVFYRDYFMYSIDNNRLANEKSILSNTYDRYDDQEFYQGEIFPENGFPLFIDAHVFLSFLFFQL